MTLRLKSDNDIMDTMGSGMVSEAFADFEKLPGKAGSIDLVEPEETKKMVVDSDLSGKEKKTTLTKTLFPDADKTGYAAAVGHGRILELVMRKVDRNQLARITHKYLQCPLLTHDQAKPGLTGSRIVHMLYFPWNKTTQTLKANESDFDHEFYERFSVLLQGKYCIKLWKLSDMRAYVTAEYPGLWELVEQKADRPVALVDFYRLLVVHDFGGIFWQYGSELANSALRRSDPFDIFMPPTGKEARLLVEKWITQEDADEMGRTRKSRKGIPPTLRRIATQVFSASPHNEFLRYASKRAIINLLTIPVERDYDILETMGNGMFSEAFNDYVNLGKANNIDVVDVEETHHMVKYSHTFSWRRDKGRCC
jgi:hypothetical protein